MQQTEHYQFNLIEGSDDFSPEPLNENIQKTEELFLTGAKCAVGTYVGTGISGVNDPNTLTFPFEPKLVVITVNGWTNYPGLILVRGATGHSSMEYWSMYEPTPQISVTWGEDSVSWYSNQTSYGDINTCQHNVNGGQYVWFAIG